MPDCEPNNPWLGGDAPQLHRDGDTVPMDPVAGIDKGEPSNNKKHRPTSVFIFLTLVVTIGGPCLFGWQLGVLNNSLLAVETLINSSIQAHYDKTVSQEAMTGWTIALSAVYVAAGAFGAAVIGPLAKKFGRRTLMFFFSAVGLVGTVMMSLSEPVNSIELLLAGRAIMGFHGGMYMGLAPMYIAECAALSYRGSSTMLAPAGVTLGIFLSSLFGLDFIFGRTGYLWALFGIPVIPILLHAAGLLRCPRSPKFLAERGLIDDAADALMRLRKAAKVDIKIELDDILEEAVGGRSLTEKFSVINLVLVKRLRRMLVVATVISVGQQLSGAGAIIFYSKYTFLESGMTDQEAAYGTLGIFAGSFLASVASVLIIDKAGRRPILLMSFCTMTITTVALVPLLKFTATCPPCSIAAIIANVVFIVTFQIGPGGIGWTLTPEMFRQEMRSTAVAFTSGLNWVFNLLVVTVFPLLQRAIGSYTFLIFAVLNLALLTFTILVVKETKGKTPTEIEDLYS